MRAPVFSIYVWRKQRLMVQPCAAPLRRVLSTSLTTALYKLGSSWNAPLCARISRLIAICDLIFYRLIAIKRKKAINAISWRDFQHWSYDVTLFSSSTAVKHTLFFCPHLFCFWGTYQADCGVGDINRKVHHPGKPSLSVYTSTRWILGGSSKVYHRDFCRENYLIWLQEC